MKKLFVLFFIATSCVAHASPIGIEAVPPMVSTEKKISPEQVIKLEKLDPKAIAYTVQYTWMKNGHKFMIVHRVFRLNIKYKQDGGADVNADIDDAIIVNVPMSLPGIKQNGFTGFIKLDEDGNMATFHPVTGKITPYQE